MILENKNFLIEYHSPQKQEKQDKTATLWSSGIIWQMDFEDVIMVKWRLSWIIHLS